MKTQLLAIATMWLLTSCATPLSHLDRTTLCSVSSVGTVAIVKGIAIAAQPAAVLVIPACYYMTAQ